MPKFIFDGAPSFPAPVHVGLANEQQGRGVAVTLDGITVAYFHAGDGDLTLFSLSSDEKDRLAARGVKLNNNQIAVDY